MVKYPDVFNSPEYWCGDIGYRPPGYQDFAIHGIKVDYILKKRPAGRVLDIGCAYGYIVRRLRSRGIDAYGLDISRYALSKAPGNVRPYLVHGSADNLPFPDKSFDMVVSFGTLEHLPENVLNHAVKEIIRIANRGIISITPAEDPLANIDPTHQVIKPLSWWRNLFPSEFEVVDDSEESWGEIRKVKEILIISTSVFPVSPYNRYAGIENLVRFIANELNFRGYRVWVAAPSGSILPEGITHIDTGTARGFEQAEKAAYYHYKDKLPMFDAILDFSHAHIAMRENGDLPAIAFIWHDPEIMVPPEPEYNICALTEWQARRFRRVYGYEAIVLDPHCVDEVVPNTGGERYLFIGRPEPNKGVFEAISICKEIGAGLDIIGARGPGDPKELIERLMSECDGEQIIYWGEVSNEVKFQFLSRAKALLHPVLYDEASSHKSIEAQCFGCPVISYARGAMNEVVGHGITGFIATSRDEFKKYMLTVDKLDRGLISRRSLSKWSVQSTTDRIVEVMEQVADGRRWGKVKQRRAWQVPSVFGYIKYSAPTYPRQIRLDTVPFCNAKCRFCHIVNAPKERYYMPADLILKVLDDISSWGKPLEEMVPVNFGEFFLRRDWLAILNLIQDKLPNTKIVIPTNGSLLDKEKVRNLASIDNIKLVNISVNAYFKETYEELMGLPGDTIARIRESVELLREIRPDITVWVSMVFDGQSETERDLFINAWKDIATVQINPASYANHPLRKPIREIKIPCRSIFDGLVVMHNGKVITGCCYDSAGVLEIGEFPGQSLLEIWGGPKLKKLQELHNSGRRNEIEICRNCTFS